MKFLAKAPQSFLSENCGFPIQRNQCQKIIQEQIIVNPYEGKKLVGDLTGFFSLRLNYKDRILYSIDDQQKLIYIHRVKTHYGE